MPRTRVKNSNVVSGRVTTLSTGSVTTRTYSDYEECVDTPELDGDNHPLQVTKSIHNRSGLINGTRMIAGQPRFLFEDYPVTYMSNVWMGSHIPITLQSNAVYAADTLARTNPSRDSTDALVSAIELREIPGLIKDSYRFAKDDLYKKVPRPAFRRLKQAAKLNLIIQFGILPIVGDVSKLLQFQQLVDQRVKELEKLQTRGLRRSIHLDARYAREDRPGTLVHSANSTQFRADLVKETFVQVKGHARWYVTQNFYQSEKELRALTASIVTRFKRTWDLESFYELMPWSWLIDYFTNLGALVNVQRNELNARYENPRIIIVRKTRVSAAPSNPLPDVSFSGMDRVTYTLTREMAVASIDARLPFLNAGQTSILASLYTTKFWGR